MKRIIAIAATVILSITAKSQTTILKQEVDTSIVNKLYSCYAIDFNTGLQIPAANQKAKKDFVNDLLIAYLRRLSRECAGGNAAEKARKQAEDNIDSKPIQKIE